MFVGLTAIASFLAAMIASAYAASTSIVKDDSVRREWWRRTVFGTVAMFVPWVAYFLIGEVIELASR
jgi:hypothetical protein